MQAGGRRFDPVQLHHNILHGHAAFDNRRVTIRSRECHPSAELGGPLAGRLFNNCIGMEGSFFRETSKQEHRVDALATEGDERRGKLR